VNYEVEAKRRVRTFFRSLKNRRWIETVNGYRNTVESVEDSQIMVNTKKQKSTFKINRNAIERAAEFLLRTRIMDKKDASQFHNYSSSMLGIIAEIMKDISKISKSRLGTIRLFLKGIRIYLSGSSKSPGDIEIAARNSGLWHLFSYAYMRYDLNENWLAYKRKFGLEGLFCDSGAYTIAAQRDRGVNVEPIDIEKYAVFCKKYKKEFHTFANLDVVGDTELTRLHLDYLYAEGIRAMPVISLLDPYEELERVLNLYDPPIVGVGSILFINSRQERVERMSKLLEIHPSVRFHAFGAIQKEILNLDIFSTDTGAWSMVVRCFRKIFSFEGQKVMPEKWRITDGISFNARFCANYERNYNGTQQELMFPSI
jgi:hypothetical protein